MADAEKYRRVAVAEGEAQAIRAVFKAIHEGGATADVLALKYFEALQKMADGQATKIYLPSGSDGLLSQLAGVAELLEPARTPPPRPARPAATAPRRRPTPPRLPPPAVS